MYIRRKVFSLGEGNIDYDYNIYQQLYSEAFEDGVDYAVEKMFGEDEKKPDKTPYVIGGTAAGILGGSIGSGIGGVAGSIKEYKKAAKEAGIKDIKIKSLLNGGTTAEKVERIVDSNSKALERIGGKTILGGALGLGTAVGGTMALYNRAKKKMNKKDGE